MPLFNHLQTLPDVDVVFQRYKLDVRVEPDNTALADSQVRQQVVKFLKDMPSRCGWCGVLRGGVGVVSGVGMRKAGGGGRGKRNEPAGVQLQAG